MAQIITTRYSYLKINRGIIWPVIGVASQGCWFRDRLDVRTKLGSLFFFSFPTKVRSDIRRKSLFERNVDQIRVAVSHSD